MSNVNLQIIIFFYCDFRVFTRPNYIFPTSTGPYLSGPDFKRELNSWRLKTKGLCIVMAVYIIVYMISFSDFVQYSCVHMCQYSGYFYSLSHGSSPKKGVSRDSKMYRGKTYYTARKSGTGMSHRLSEK